MEILVVLRGEDEMAVSIVFYRNRSVRVAREEETSEEILFEKRKEGIREAPSRRETENRSGRDGGTGSAGHTSDFSGFKRRKVGFEY